MTTSSSYQGLSQRHCGVLHGAGRPQILSTGNVRDDKPIPCTRPTACVCLVFSLALADGYLRFKWTQRGNGSSTYLGVVYMADDFSVTMPPSRLIYLALVSRPLLIRSAMHAPSREPPSNRNGPSSSIRPSPGRVSFHCHMHFLPLQSAPGWPSWDVTP